MSARPRFFVAALAVLAALSILPRMAGATSQPPPPPPEPPPICTLGKVLPFICAATQRSDIYPKGDCPNSQAKDYVICQNLPNAPYVGLDCDYFDGYTECEGLPQSTTQGLTYSWSASSLLRIDLPISKSVVNRFDPKVTVTCRATSGYGWLTLTVTTQQNVSNSLTYWFNCAL